MTTIKIDARDLIVALATGDIVTVAFIEQECNLSNKAARNSLISAFCEGLLKPVYRLAGSKERWEIHLMALARMDATDIEVAFVRV